MLFLAADLAHTVNINAVNFPGLDLPHHFTVAGVQQPAISFVSACADNFYGSGAYSLRRIDPQQTEKDTCTYCNQRTGYDYEIIPKNR